MSHRIPTFLLTAAAFAAFAGSAAAATPDSVTLAALEQEASRGRIDRAVVADLSDDGRAEAIMTIKAGGMVRRAQVGLPRGRERAEKLIQRLRPELAEEKREALARAGSEVDVERAYPNLPASFVEIESADAALDLLRDPQVDGLRENRTLGLETAQSMPVIRQPAAAAAGRTGAGTYTLILDTGIKAANAPFGCVAGAAGCRVASSWDAAPNDGADDDDGHGTNVAAIAASVAPGTKILAVDVFQRNAATGRLGADPSHVLAGINWAMDLRRQGYNVTSLNMSIGAPEAYYTSSCATSVYATTFAAARALGITPVVSAGNDGTVGGRVQNGVTFPACTPGAVSVGATYDGNLGGLQFSNCTDFTTAQDKITCFSQRGPTLSLFAPGSTISAGGYAMSGTSQAAPHVAGAASVLAAARPGATVAQIEDALVKSGPEIADAATGITRRRLDLPGAVSRLVGTGGQAPVMTTAPVHTISGPLGAATVPVSFAYAGTDDVAVTRYETWFRVNAGAWRAVTLASPTTRSFSLAATPGASYQVAVRALDASGNASAWSYSTAVTVGLAQDNWSGIAYSSGWTRATSTAASGGALVHTSTANAQVRVTFTGRQIAWFGIRAANRGRSYVYADGVYVGTVDQYAAATQWRVKVFGHRFAAAGPHTLLIRNAGTAGRPTIDLDAVAFTS